MARFEMTSPEGKRYEITAPDGGTEAEVLDYAREHFRSEARKPKFDLLDGLSRQVGLTARASVQGLAAIPNMIGDAIGLKSSKAASDTQQMIAALMGSLAPGGAPYAGKAIVRGAARGGEQGGTILNENLRLLMETGTPPTVGLASNADPSLAGRAIKRGLPPTIRRECPSPG